MATAAPDTTPTTASLLAGFPVPQLSIVATEDSAPTFETLFILQRELNNNAISVASERGDGASGHLVLTCPPDVFRARPGYVRFVVPVNPGRNPRFPANATDVRIRALTLEHSNNYKDYVLHRNTDDALKQQLLKACPTLYLKPLQHPTEGFANVSTLQLMTHLLETYGAIDPDEVFDKNTKLGTPWWQPPKPVELLFEEIEKSRTFILAAGSNIDDTMLIQAVYINFKHTGLFEQECREWFQKSAADKTWANVQTFFAKADKNRSKLTASDVGFSSANAVTTTTPAQKRKANDTVTDSANAVTTPNTEIAKLRNEIATLSKKLKTQHRTNRASTNNNNNSTSTPTIPKGSRPYCWSHGFTKHWRHNSLTCRNRHPDHKETATSESRMGGSEYQYSAADRRDPDISTVE